MDGDFQVGEWLVQPKLHSVSNGGQSVTLEPKVMQVLVQLAEHGGEVVEKEKLIHAVWADTFVTDDVLTRAISELRRTFDDDPKEPRYIQTIPRSGYRLIAPVEPVAPVSPPAASAVPLRRGPPLQRPLLLTVGGLVVLLAIFFALNMGGLRDRWLPPPAPPAGKVRLVVLPFDNYSGDPEQEYFSDGITEEMTAQLAQLSPERLAVIGRASAMTYKGARKTIDQIGGELSVQYVLEGSVRRQGERVRVTAQLIKVGEETHVWAESYDRDLRDILAVQSDVARAVASEINLHLTPEQKSSLMKAYRTTPEAHEAYLRGRYFWGKRTQAGIQKGLEYFQQAVKLDPSYATAYAGLADSYILLGPWTEARVFAVKALEMDNTLGEAHTSLAQIRFISDWDWLGADREFRRAIELAPNYAMAHHWYSGYLQTMGRLPEGIAEAKRALELEPLSLIINAGLGGAYYNARQYDSALTQLGRTLEMDPRFLPALVQQGQILEKKGMLREAIATLEKAVALSPAQGALLGRMYALAGRRSDALRALKTFKAAGFQRGYTDLALLYSGLGEKEQAFACLERAYLQREYDVLSLKVEPEFDSLRSDPRYQALLRRMNFPP